MGVNDAQRSAREDKQRKSTEKKRRTSQSQKGGITADWGNASADLVLAAIAAITVDGGAIRFGYTRDGGAFAIGIYEGGEMSTEYVSPNDDIDVYLKGVIDDFAK